MVSQGERVLWDPALQRLERRNQDWHVWGQKVGRGKDMQWSDLWMESGGWSPSRNLFRLSVLHLVMHHVWLRGNATFSFVLVYDGIFDNSQMWIMRHMINLDYAIWFTIWEEDLEHYRKTDEEWEIAILWVLCLQEEAALLHLSTSTHLPNNRKIKCDQVWWRFVLKSIDIILP